MHSGPSLFLSVSRYQTLKGYVGTYTGAFQAHYLGRLKVTNKQIHCSTTLQTPDPPRCPCSAIAEAYASGDAGALAEALAAASGTGNSQALAEAAAQAVAEGADATAVANALAAAEPSDGANASSLADALSAGDTTTVAGAIAESTGGKRGTVVMWVPQQFPSHLYKGRDETWILSEG